MRLALLLFLFALLPAQARAGSDELRWCRGGTNHGDPCAVDGDCAGGDDVTTGICTARGMPRVCIGRHFCSVSTSIECFGNDDCTPAHGGTWPTDPADYCPQRNFHVLGCSVAAADTQGPGDCGECASGVYKGHGCLNDADCPGTTCDKSPGLGKCSDGAGQCEMERCGHRGYGVNVPGDTLADRVVGPKTLGGNHERVANAFTLVSPGEVEVMGGFLFVSERRRIARYPYPAAVSATNIAATGFAGQIDSEEYIAFRLGDDINNAGIGLFTPETLGSIWATGTSQHRPIACVANSDLKGCLVGDESRLLLMPSDLPTDSAASQAWGHRDLVGSRVGDADPTRQLNRIAGVAAMKRCVGGTAIGTPCKVDRDCAASTCATTIAVADKDVHRIVVQRSPGTDNGSAFDVVLGQPDFTSATPNAGGRSAATLASPRGIDFDASGNLWVADHDNHRIVRFPRAFVTGTPADVLLGQADFSTATEGTSAINLRSPFDVAFDRKNNILFAADHGNHRVLRWNDPAQDATADGVIGSPSFATLETGMASSDGVQCDRLSGPSGVAVDGANHVWVADRANNRVLAYSYTPDGGSESVARVRQGGQPSCATRFEGAIEGSSVGLGEGGVWLWNAGSTEGVCLTDEFAHRVLCWKDKAAAASAAATTPPADVVLGQSDATGYQANRGGPIAAVGLKAPSFGSAAAAGSLAGAIFLADSGNNRVVGYAQPLSTGMAATSILGASADGTCGVANGQRAVFCNPNAAKFDQHGNLWVVDTGNGRVLLYCHSAGSVMGAGGAAVCSAANQGDDVPDLILGKPNLSSGHADSYCTQPTARTLCRPWDIDFDTARGRVLVGDRGEGFVPAFDQANAALRGRTLVYEAPFASNMAASYVLGIPSNSLTTYEGSSNGFCNGGPTPGVQCNADDDTSMQGGVSEACGPGGWCDWSRSFPGHTITYDRAYDRLYVDHGGSIAEVLDMKFPPPTPSMGTGPQMGRVMGATNERTYSVQGIGYTSCQWSRGRGQVSIDSDGALWVQQGFLGGEHNGSVFVMLNPVPATTPTVTPTPGAQPSPRSTRSAGEVPRPTQRPSGKFAR